MAPARQHQALHADAGIPARPATSVDSEGICASRTRSSGRSTSQRVDQLGPAPAERGESLTGRVQNAGGAPGDAGEESGIAARQPDQPIAAILRGTEHGIVALRQCVSRGSHIVEAHARAVGADDDHAPIAAQTVLGGGAHARTQVAAGLQVHFYAEDAPAALDEGVFAGRSGPHFHGTDTRKCCRSQCVAHQPAVELQCTFRAEHREQPCLDLPQHGRLAKHLDYGSSQASPFPLAPAFPRNLVGRVSEA